MTTFDFCVNIPNTCAAVSFGRFLSYEVFKLKKEFTVGPSLMCGL